MRQRPWVFLAALGLLGGCTTFVPVQHDGGGTWAEARQAPYQSNVSRFAAAQGEQRPAAGATATGAPRPVDAPVIATGPIEPASVPDSFDPRPLPPLQGQANGADAWADDPWRQPPDVGWRSDAPSEPAPVVAAAPEPVVARAPEPEPVRAAPAPSPQAGRPGTVAEAASGSTSLTPPALSNVGFLWPADGEIRDGRSAGAPSHVANGLTIQAGPGDPFVASENGIVVFAGDSMQTYGNMVVIRHDGDYTTAYGHAERLDVAVGDVVRRGQRLGVVGATGAVNDPQLYFEMRVGSQVVDPRHYLMGSPQVASN